MKRLEPLDADRLNPDQQALLAAVESGPRHAKHGRIGLLGPFGIWMRAPKLGQAAQAFGAVVRFGTSLPENVKEIAICTVGAHFRSKFEFAAHGPLALAAGVDAAALEAIRVGQPPALSSPAEALAYEITSSLLTRHRLTDAQFEQARRVFNEAELVELVTVIGYYCQISLTLNAFAAPLAANMEDPFPEVE